MTLPTISFASFIIELYMFLNIFKLKLIYKIKISSNPYLISFKINFNDFQY
jgi:hypothetical protein